MTKSGSAWRRAPFIDQYAALVRESAAFALDAARLLVGVGMPLDDAFSAVVDAIDSELLQFDGASALGIARFVVEQGGGTVPAAWLAHLDQAGLA